MGEGGWVPASARTTGGGVGGGRFPNRPYEGLAYNGRPQGSPLQEKDGGVGEGEWIPACARTTGGGVGGRAVPEPPLRRVGRTAYNGRPQGSPLQGEDGRVGKGGWVPASARTTGGGVGGGRFPNRPYEGLVAQHITGDHKGRPYRRRMAGWGKGNGFPHSRGQREGESGGGRFPNRPFEGLVAQHITGDHKGRPYRGRMAGWGKGDGSPHPRGQREGESGAGGSRTAPTRGWSHSIYRATTRVAPTGEGWRGGGRGMGPRIREDNGKGESGAGGSRTAPTRGWSHSI